MQCGKKKEKDVQTGKDEIKMFLFIDDMNIYIESSKESTDEITKTNK